MNAGLFAQYVMNGLMLGMMYALVAVGFTLFFGVLDVIKFSHGDVLTVGSFTALATYVGLTLLGLQSHWLVLMVMLVVAFFIHKAPIRNHFPRCCRADRSISAHSTCVSTTC